MTNSINLSIEIFPVEIFHRIFDNLDVQTILFSIRPVCRLFRAVVNTYDRYVFDFKSISKSNFHLICRLINPQNVISLILCDNEYTPNQIDLFISLVRLQQFTRLHSITFINIEEVQLNKILKRINRNSLTSFSLNIQKYDDRRKKTTLNFLSSILTQSNIRKIELNIKIDRILNILWPLNCKIRYLIINEDISLDDICRILFCSPQLHTLILKQRLFNINKNKNQRTSFPQITSLTIEKVNITIDELESFLLLMPSLIYLKLISNNELIFDGKRWEEFIQINLSHLNNFEFFINISRSNSQTVEDLNLIIKSFQSSFWIEYKKWFVACEFNINRSYEIQLYSIPICKSILQYELNSEKIFVSNYAGMIRNDPLIINNINEIILSLRTIEISKIEKESVLRNNPLFPNVTKLSIDISRRHCDDSIEFLKTIINISQLVEVKLESYCFNKDNINLLYNIITILEQSYNLSLFIIYCRFSQFELYPFLNKICSMIPRQIKHLQIPINQLDQIEIIFERCLYLSSIQFHITRLKFSQEVIQWFNKNTINSTIQRLGGNDTIWIGKKIDQINFNHKRIKLTENEFDF